MRKMTFDIPDDVAERFTAKFPASEHSAILTQHLEQFFRRELKEEEWDAICEAANNDPETQEIQRENALPNTMTE